MDFKNTARILAENSAVLLKNDGSLLPFTPGKKIAVFGWAQMEPVLSGNGSGASHGLQAEDYVTALRRAGVQPVEPLVDFYAKETAARQENALPDFDFSQFKHMVTSGLMYEVFGRYTPNPTEYTPAEDLLSQAAGKTDTALWIIGRQSGGEECDRHLENDYYLSPEEDCLLYLLKSRFENIAVVLNINGLMDLSWTDDPQIKSVLFLGIPGQEGPEALANLLTGKSNPSGKLSVSIAKKYEDYPTFRDFSWEKSNSGAILTYENYGLAPTQREEQFAHRPVTAYREDIYLGYRYFDTFQLEPLYPFGFGLSYTDFSILVRGIQKVPGGITVTASVTNNGHQAGREVVQLYVAPQSTASAQPEKTLRAFAKTKLLAPSEKTEITLTLPWRELATYREKDAAWVIEAGEYAILLGNSSRNVRLAAVVKVEADILAEQTGNRLSMDPETRRKLALLTAKAAPADHGIEGYPVVNLTREEVSPWKAPAVPVPDCASLSDDQLAALCVGYGPGIPFSAFLEVPYPNTISDEAGNPIAVNDHPTGVNGYVSPAIPAKGIHSVFYKDGPAGIGDTGWPGEMLLACSFDRELLRAFGDAVRQECEGQQVDVWLAPALNLHRHPLGGRGFEYFSEDPYLTGVCAAAVLQGLQSDGKVLACAKHFAANEQETYRRGSAKLENGLPAFDAVDSLVTERALRELYLKPFEMAVKEGGLRCIMTSFNKINGTFAGGSKDLCTHILREEWGFDGLVVTDWGDMDIVVDGADAVAAGNDVIMPGGPPVIEQIQKGLADGRVTRKDLETAVGHLRSMLQRLGRWEGA